jgi:hypothetical protein
MGVADDTGPQRKRRRKAKDKLNRGASKAFEVTAQAAHCTPAQLVTLRGSLTNVLLCRLHGTSVQKAATPETQDPEHKHYTAASLLRVPLPVYTDFEQTDRILLHELAPALSLPARHK